MDTASRLITLTQEIGRILRQRARHIGDGKINFLQIFALAMIDDHPNMTMKEFAESMKVSSPSATSFIDRLVKLGWAKRREDAENRKLVLLSLTPVGKQMLAKKMKERAALIRQIIALIPETDQRHLERILTGLHAALGKTAVR